MKKKYVLKSINGELILFTIYAKSEADLYKKVKRMGQNPNNLEIAITA